jgi:hypothetical protein
MPYNSCPRQISMKEINLVHTNFKIKDWHELRIIVDSRQLLWPIVIGIIIVAIGIKPWRQQQSMYQEINQRVRHI